MLPKKTLVIGASPNPERYAFKAVSDLKEHGHPVLALGLRTGEINGIPIFTDKKEIPNLDTISLYVSAKNQADYLPYILQLHPQRVVFNPGTENPEIYPILQANNIEVLEACTLVMLSIGNY